MNLLGAVFTLRLLLELRGVLVCDTGDAVELRELLVLRVLLVLLLTAAGFLDELASIGVPLAAAAARCALGERPDFGNRGDFSSASRRNSSLLAARVFSLSASALRRA